MGVYVYALVAASKKVGPIEVGVFEYAYKCTGWMTDREEAYQERKLQAAERARKKLAHVRYGVQGALRADCVNEVYSIPTHRHSFYDTSDPGPIVGTITKVKNRWKFTPNAKFHELEALTFSPNGVG